MLTTVTSRFIEQLATVQCEHRLHGRGLPPMLSVALGGLGER